MTGVRETKTATPRELIALMVGRELSFEPDHRRARRRTPPSLLRSRTSVADRVVSASFSLRYGEIVCLAGLLGAGRTEVCEAIFGARPIAVGQRPWSKAARCGRAAPPNSMAAGISMLPEDRKESGLFIDFTITANVVAANLAAYTHAGLLSKARDAARSAGSYVRRAAHRHAERRSRGSLSFGWQPAEGAARQMAGAPRRASSSSMSRHAASTSAPRLRSTASFATWPPAASRSWWCLPTCPRSSRWRIASWSCRRGASSASSTLRRQRRSLYWSSPPPRVRWQDSMSNDVSPPGSSIVGCSGEPSGAPGHRALAWPGVARPYRHRAAAPSHRSHRRPRRADDHPRARPHSRARQTLPSCFSIPRRPASWRAG